MSSPFDPHGPSQPAGHSGPSFEPAGGAPSWVPQPSTPPSADPYGQPSANPYAPASASPYGQPSADPYAAASASPYGQPSANPYGQSTDRYGQYGAGPGQYPGAQPPNLYGMDPYGTPAGNDIYGVYQYQAPTKSKAAAALLAFFLGGVGAHNFYLRQNMRGWLHVALGPLVWLLMLVFAVMAVNNPAGEDTFFALFGLLYVVTTGNGIWAFVEFIIILTKPEHELGR